MSRPPYTARLVAGLVATTLEETRKLPTRVITLPMSAVSMGLQAGMRLQQNIAELAIKGDEFLAPLCDTAEEQPEWARFDDDDEPEPQPLLPDAPARVEATTTPAPTTPTEPTAERAEPANDQADGPGAVNTGRFALYSSAPADVEPGATTKSADDSSDGPLPGIVGELDYPNLTLAQLRAKVRGLSTDDLAELLAYEKGARNRTPFVTMIDNRIVSQQKKSDAAQ